MASAQSQHIASGGIGLVGLSWRHAPSGQLAQFTLPREARAAHLRELANLLGVEELLYLATCNRVELLYAGGEFLGAAERRRRVLAHFAAPPDLRALRAWEGEGAVEHLFLVASGLDSARVGESEITGQLKAAAQEAEEAGLVGPRLRELIDDTLRVARRVRPLTEGHVGRASLADVALRYVHARLAVQPGAVALVGVSPMTAHCAAALAEQGVPLVLVNRTVAKAQEIAPPQSRVRSIEAFRLAPDAVSAVVLATGASEPLFDAADCARLARRGAGALPPLVVDLGVPASLRAEEAERAGIEHIGMDAITRAAEADRDDALTALGDARALVDAELDERRRRLWTALVSPTIAELRRRYADRTATEVERLLETELRTLDETQALALRRWAASLSHQMAHLPSRGLRDLVAAAGPDAAAEFLGNAEPDLATELRHRAARRGADAIAESA